MNPELSELIRRYARNLAAVIAETRPSLDELRDLLETEMGKLVGECATAEVLGDAPRGWDLAEVIERR